MLSDSARIARFELRRWLRDPYLLIGVAAFMLIAAAGAYVYWRSAVPRPPGGRVFSEAYLMALVIAFHCGLARDRMAGFDRYQVANFAGPGAVYFGHILAALAFLVGFGLFGFLYALVLALGDVSYAAEYALRMFYVSLIMLPFVVLLELGLSTRMPVPFLLIVFMVAGMLYARMGDARHISLLFGFDEMSAPGMTVRALAALLLTAAWYPLVVKRLGRVSLASG